DLSEARRAPGVRATLVWKEPGTGPANEVRYQGEPVAAVAADTEEQAIDAARLVKVTYDVLDHVVTEAQAMANDAPVAFQGGNTRKGAVQETGDLEAGFKQA